MASDSAASLQPGGRAASVGVQEEAGAANNRAEGLKPEKGEASNGAARSGGGYSRAGALLDWRTLRLCASFSLQARGPSCSALTAPSAAWQPVLGLVHCAFLSQAAGVLQQPRSLACCHVCAQVTTSPFLLRNSVTRNAQLGPQAAEKLVLAEGSKAVLVATQSAAEQGAYGLASNLGSLVVRTLFQPFEEAAFLAFSRSGAGGGGGGGAALPAKARLARVLAVAVRTVSIVGAVHQEPGALGRAPQKTTLCWQPHHPRWHS